MDLAEVAQMLCAVVEAVDQGHLGSPRWLRDRIKATAAGTSALAGDAGD